MMSYRQKSKVESLDFVVPLIHELTNSTKKINKGYKVMFSFLRIKEYTKLRSHEPVSNPQKLAPANFNDSTVFDTS